MALRRLTRELKELETNAVIRVNGGPKESQKAGCICFGGNQELCSAANTIKKKLENITQILIDPEIIGVVYKAHLCKQFRNDRKEWTKKYGCPDTTESTDHIDNKDYKNGDDGIENMTDNNSNNSNGNKIIIVINLDESNQQRK